MIIIGRYIGETTLNGREYVLNAEGAPLEFNDVQEARDYLMELGAEEDDLDDFLYEEV